jgi:hypothetical protein
VGGVPAILWRMRRAEDDNEAVCALTAGHVGCHLRLSYRRGPSVVLRWFAVLEPAVAQAVEWAGQLHANGWIDPVDDDRRTLPPDAEPT